MRPYLWMILGSFVFALMAALVHAAGAYWDWRVVAVARTGLCLLFVAGFAWLGGARLVLFGPRALWMRSLAGSISLVCTFFALPRLPVSDVLTLSNMFPIWVAILSWPILKEVPGPGVWLAAGTGVLGVGLIQQPHLAAGNFASLVVLTGSFFTALAMIGLHRLKDIDPRAIVVHFSAVSLVFALATFLPVTTDGGAGSVSEVSGDPSLTLPALLILLGVGLTASVGQLCLTLAFTGGSPAKVSVVGLCQVVFAIGLDVFFWRRSFDLTTLAGIALVLAPTAWLMTSQPGEAADTEIPDL